MTTYNGSSYALEQLQSFEKQSIPPDEIIICDDGSKDNTLEIIEKFREQSGLNIKLIKNEENLGVIKNFEKAISLTTGDIIFISDQDDYWFPNKLEDYLIAFKSNPDVDYIFSDLQVTDKHLNKKPGSLFNSVIRRNTDNFVGKNTTSAKSFLSMKLASSGATIAVRKKLLNAILPIPEIKDLLHDGWIGRIASSISKGKLLPFPYSYYRQHENNVDGYKSNIRSKILDLQNLRSFRESEYNYLKIIRQRLVQLNFANKDEIINITNAKLYYLKKQLSLFHTKKTLSKLLLILQYQYKGVYETYYRGYRTFLKELLALLIGTV